MGGIKIGEAHSGGMTAGPTAEVQPERADLAPETVSKPADAVRDEPRPALHVVEPPASGARPQAPAGGRTLWLGASGGSTLQLGDADRKRSHTSPLAPT